MSGHDDDFEDIEAALRQAARDHKIEIDPFDEDEPEEIKPENDLSRLTNEELDERQAQLEERLSRIVKDSHISNIDEVDLPLSEAELADLEISEKLSKLEKAAQNARKSEHLRINEQSIKQASDRSAAKGLGVGMSIAYGLIGMPIVGYFVGMLLDGGQPNGNAKMIGAMIGIGIGFGFMIFQIRRYSDE